MLILAGLNMFIHRLSTMVSGPKPANTITSGRVCPCCDLKIVGNFRKISFDKLVH